jgi:prepilin-type N-terminal cleavage/methylation domain-containing protein
MKKSTISQRYSKGFTFVELMIVLSVASIATAALIAFGSAFFNGPKYEDMVDTHTSVVNNVLKQYGYRPFIDTVTPANTVDTDMVIDLKMVDSERVRVVSGSNVVATSFENSYWTISTTTGQPNRFNFNYTGVPSESCTEFLPSVAGRATTITVTPTGGTTTTVKSAGGNVAIGALSTACSAANTLGMTFVYAN